MRPALFMKYCFLATLLVARLATAAFENLPVIHLAGGERISVTATTGDTEKLLLVITPPSSPVTAQLRSFQALSDEKAVANIEKIWHPIEPPEGRTFLYAYGYRSDRYGIVHEKTDFLPPGLWIELEATPEQKRLLLQQAVRGFEPWVGTKHEPCTLHTWHVLQNAGLWSRWRPHSLWPADFVREIAENKLSAPIRRFYLAGTRAGSPTEFLTEIIERDRLFKETVVRLFKLAIAKGSPPRKVKVLGALAKLVSGENHEAWSRRIGTTLGCVAHLILAKRRVDTVINVPWEFAEQGLFRLLGRSK
ncbi:hypothetical protein K2X33_07670 [bacterium]|nr:hypothetical protein [bacterium]